MLDKVRLTTPLREIVNQVFARTSRKLPDNSIQASSSNKNMKVYPNMIRIEDSDPIENSVDAEEALRTEHINDTTIVNHLEHELVSIESPSKSSTPSLIPSQDSEQTSYLKRDRSTSNDPALGSPSQTEQAADANESLSLETLKRARSETSLDQNSNDVIEFNSDDELSPQTIVTAEMSNLLRELKIQYLLQEEDSIIGDVNEPNIIEYDSELSRGERETFLKTTIRAISLRESENAMVLGRRYICFILAFEDLVSDLANDGYEGNATSKIVDDLIQVGYKYRTIENFRRRGKTLKIIHDVVGDLLYSMNISISYVYDLSKKQIQLLIKKFNSWLTDPTSSPLFGIHRVNPIDINKIIKHNFTGWVDGDMIAIFVMKLLRSRESLQLSQGSSMFFFHSCDIFTKTKSVEYVRETYQHNIAFKTPLREISKKMILLIPYHVNESHWVLVCVQGLPLSIANGTSCSIYIYDSLAYKLSEEEIIGIKQKLMYIFELGCTDVDSEIDESDFIVTHIIEARLQNNNYECGVFVMMFCREIILHPVEFMKDPTFVIKSIESQKLTTHQLRVEFYDEIREYVRDHVDELLK